MAMEAVLVRDQRTGVPRVRASALRDPPHCHRARVAICHLPPAATRKARQSGSKTAPGRSPVPTHSSPRSPVSKAERNLPAGRPGGLSAPTRENSAVAAAALAAPILLRQSLQSAAKVRQTPPVTSSKYQFIVLGDSASVLGRSAEPKSRWFEVFLTCFVLTRREASLLTAVYRQKRAAAHARRGGFWEMEDLG